MEQQQRQQQRPPLATWSGRGELPPGQQGHKPDAETAKVQAELRKDMDALGEQVSCLHLVLVVRAQ